MKIKVAFLEEDAKIGGAEINVLNLIQKLDLQKIETFVVCPCKGPLTERVKEIGGKFAIVPRFPFISTSLFFLEKKISNPFAVFWNLISFIPTSWRLFRFLKKESIDVLHTNSMFAHFYGAVACRVADTKCVWHIQDIVDPKQALGFFKMSLNFAGRWLPHRIIVVSGAVGKMFDGGTKNRVRIIYNGTDLQKFNPSLSGASVRKEFDILPDEFVIGMVGRIVRWKGHKELLHAAKRILDKDPKIKFLIVGDTSFGRREFLAELKSLVVGFGLEKNIIFTGFREDVPDLIGAMDICVHASNLPDPCPLVVFDYMAGGKPIVATNGGGVPEVVRDGITGILVPMSDSESLANGIMELLNDPEKRAAMGIAGRERVEKFFPLDAFVKNMNKQYIELALNI